MKTTIEGLHPKTHQPVRLLCESGLITAIDAIDSRPDLRLLRPALVDNHCHILPTGLDMQKVPLGDCHSPEAVLERVRESIAEVEGSNWLLAVHYDQTRFPTGEHLHRSQLDAISTEIPILLRHVNGHASVANTPALERGGVRGDTPDPKGGTYVRDAAGDLTGVLLEKAHEVVTSRVPNPTLRQMVDAIVAASKSMADYGLVAAADMMTGRYDLEQELEAYRIASEEGCTVALRLYLQWSCVFGPRPLDPARLAELAGAMNPARCRVAGIKIFADGAIGSRTAAIYGAYEGSDSAEDEGTLIYQPQRLTAMVETAHRAGYSVAVHTIGDRSTDLVMDAFAATDAPERHRIEHVMMLSDAQIERLAALGCPATMQPEFLLAFGHSYRRQLGQERAFRLKRMRSVWDAGVPLSLSSDRPIVSGDPLQALAAATERPEGFDPSECLTPEEARWAHSEGGALAMGDRPDFAVGGLAWWTAD